MKISNPIVKTYQIRDGKVLPPDQRVERSPKDFDFLDRVAVENSMYQSEVEEFEKFKRTFATMKSELQLVLSTDNSEVVEKQKDSHGIDSLFGLIPKKTVISKDLDPKRGSVLSRQEEAFLVKRFDYEARETLNIEAKFNPFKADLGAELEIPQGFENASLLHGRKLDFTFEKTNKGQRYLLGSSGRLFQEIEVDENDGNGTLTWRRGYEEGIRSWSWPKLHHDKELGVETNDWFLWR